MKASVTYGHSFRCVRLQVELAGRVFRYPPSARDGLADGEDEAEGIPDVEWLLEFVRRQVGRELRPGHGAAAWMHHGAAVWMQRVLPLCIGPQPGCTGLWLFYRVAAWMIG